jgi:hypothetical protein
MEFPENADIQPPEELVLPRRHISGSKWGFRWNKLLR